MSLKLKIPLMMLLVLLVNIVVLVLCFLFCMMPDLEHDINAFQSEANSMIEDLSRRLDGSDLEESVAVLTALTEEDDDLSFTLQSIASKEKTVIPPERAADDLGFSAVTSLRISGADYTLLLRRDLKMVQSLDGTIVRIVGLALLTFTLSFVICGALMHFQYVLPLIRLKNEMKCFRSKGARLKQSKRRDELGDLENSFFAMTEDLTKEKQNQKRIIASIAHDIKTPLTSVMGFSERLLKKDIGAGRQQSYLQTIYTQAQNINAIVDEFDEYISFSLESQLDLQVIEVSYLCSMLEDEYREIAAAEGFTFLVENNCSRNTVLPVDTAKVRRVFANLIDNSIRHNQREGLCISVSVAYHGGFVRFTVEDNGSGVSEHNVAHVFEPFFTSDSSRKVSGLGLSICAEIVQTHCGAISAKNTETGFAVEIDFPATD